MKQILAFSHARKSYDGKVVLDDVTLAFLPGAKIGVVGPNGMGKSTLMRMMAGQEQPSNGEVLEVIREAERTVYRAQWRIWEELAVEHLACTSGLARAGLVPGSDVIQVVTWDGEYLGHVRRDRQCPLSECWVAVLKRHARPCGRYDSAQAAAAALAQACGKATRSTG